MLRVRNISAWVLICLHACLQEALAHSIRLQENYVVQDMARAVADSDWKCENNFDCSVNNSSCVGGICQCFDGYIFNGDMTACIKAATTYADDCVESIQCSRYLFSGGTCMNAICVCTEGYYYMHGRCNAYSGLFGKCHKDDDCYVNGDFEATSCINGTCKCSSGFYQREYRTCRRKANGPGDTCSIDNDCKQFDNRAYCDFDNVCYLPDTNSSVSEYSSNNDFPEKHDVHEGIQLGEKCVKDADCKHLEHALCDPSGICVCKRAHFFIEELGKCVPELGEPCQPEDNIYIDYSECRDGKWNCEPDRAVSRDNRNCEKTIKRYNDYCRNDIQCFAFGPDAICKDNRCICNNKSRFNETEMFCWMKRSIGETCQQDVDCYVDGIDVKLSCTNNICTCPSGTYPSLNNTACLDGASGIGSKCEVDNDCAHENSKCVNTVCACKDNYYVSGNECVPGINATCATNSDCLPENSECVSDQCACQKGYVAPSTSSCIPVASFGQACKEDIQCSIMLPNSVCSSDLGPGTNVTINSKCACAEGYHYKFSKCFKRKVLGMSCENLGECYLDSGDSAVCKNGLCACDWGYVQANDTVCKADRLLYVNSGNATNVTLGLLTIFLLLITFSI